MDGQFYTTIFWDHPNTAGTSQSRILTGGQTSETSYCQNRIVRNRMVRNLSTRFRQLQDGAWRTGILAHHVIKKRFCVYKVACDSLFSGLVTKVTYEDLPKPHTDQHHKALGFLSDHFSIWQFRWSNIEEEGFSVVKITDEIHWLLAMTEWFDLCTDYNLIYLLDPLGVVLCKDSNLIYLLDPLAVVPDFALYSLLKVLHWAVSIRKYNYMCVHIKRIDNMLGEIIALW